MHASSHPRSLSLDWGRGPGKDQRPDRHNGVASFLAIHGEGAHSMIEGGRLEWSPGAARITPPAELHSHHNRDRLRMMSLVVRDEGLHSHTRTPGFARE